jgi:hypothetical protein
MATITGTKRNVLIVKRPDTPYDTIGVYRVTADFAAYTGSTDDGALAGVGAFITASVRDGKTRKMRTAQCVGAGSDGTQSIFAGDCTVSSDALAFNLTASAKGTELTSSTATTVPVTFEVVCEE